MPIGRPIEPALAGTATFVVNRSGGGLAVTDARHRTARVVATDVFASNGVVHAIDRVLLPPAH